MRILNQERMIFLRSVLARIVKVILVSGIISLLIFLGYELYKFGYSYGFREGQKNAEDYYLDFIEELNKTGFNDVIITPVVTQSPRIITLPTKTPTWGGPELWEAVNKRRQELGVNPLKTKTDLCTIASIRLNELIALGKLDAHVGFSNLPKSRPDLKWIFDNYSNMAEFLAMGGKSPQETVSLWENTLGHKQLLIGGEYVWGCIYAQNTFAVAIAAY